MAKTREELYWLHQELCKDALNTMEKKQHDYAAEADIFRNLRQFGRFGILVRLSDKISRLQSFLENREFAVADEGELDTVRDIINYTILFAAYEEPEYNGTRSTNPKGHQGAKQDGSKEIPNRNVVLERKETKSEVGGKVARRCIGCGGQVFVPNAFCGACAQNCSIGDASGYPD